METTSKSAPRLRITRVENVIFRAPAASLAVERRDRAGPLVILRARGRIMVVAEASIDWIDGAGNYVLFHAGSDRHCVRGTLSSLAGVLSPQFVRSCRSTIVNLAAVREFVRTPVGDLVAVLHSGHRLAVGRRFRDNVEAALAPRP